MAMTRKHFKAIAEIINQHTNIGDEPTINSQKLIVALAVKFSDFNPGFHRLKFFETASERLLEWQELKRQSREASLSWSERYYPGLPPEAHGANNSWMRDVLAALNDTGTIFVPNIGKVFNKQGEEIDTLFGTVNTYDGHNTN